MSHDQLVIRIFTFGFHKSGLPADSSGHGGGFSFDCRGLPNPGREEAFKEKTGLDPEVQRYLEQSIDVRRFLDHVFGLIELTARDYERRDFTDLMVSFGCTGGQHRSVYCAEMTASRLREAGFTVELTHIDKPSFQ